MADQKLYSAKKIPSRFKKLLKTAETKNLIVTLDFISFKTMLNRGCFYCEGTLLDNTGYNIDRKNNNLGYEIENCVPCCSICNRIKSDIFTFNEFIELSKTTAFLEMKKRYLNFK